MGRSLKSNVMVKVGLLMFPVSIDTVVSAVSETQFNMICDGSTTTAHDPVRVRQDTKCPTCSNDERASFKRGSTQGDTVIVVPQEEIDKAGAPDEVKNSIALTTHPADQVEHTLPTGKVYYLTPAATAGEMYPMIVALVERRKDLAFLCEFAVRSVSSMYRLDVFQGALVIRELAWPEQVNAAPATQSTFNEALFPQAEMFADVLKSDFDASTYRDKRSETLRNFMAEQQGVALSRGDGEPASPVAGMDLAAQLQAAVAAAQAEANGGKPVIAAVPTTKAPAKKRATKKAAAAAKAS